MQEQRTKLAQVAVVCNAVHLIPRVRNVCACKHGGELAMHHHIGVAADGRRKVRVIRRVEGKVPPVLLVLLVARAKVLGELHGAGKHRSKRGRLRRSGEGEEGAS